MIYTALIAWAAIAVIMFFVWLLAIKKDNAAIVDLAWTLSVPSVALFYAYYFITSKEIYQYVALSFILIWGARLFMHLYIRLDREKLDPRYEALKDRLGSLSKISWLGFYQLQGLSVILLSLPFLLLFSSNFETSAINLIGLIMLFLAIGGEAISDLQLEQFKLDPQNKGKVCSSGLWAYSRHPNYFFEWLFWLSWVFVSYGADYWYLSIISPILMYHFIVNVTGIPPAEARALTTKGEAYREYMNRTSAFFPLPQKLKTKETNYERT